MKVELLKRYIYPHEAQLDKVKLEAHGIKCVIRDELTAQVNNFLSNAIGGVKLFVDEVDLEGAKEILNDEYSWDQKELEDFDTDKDSKITCVACGSHDVGSPRLKGGAALLSILLFGFPLPILRRRAHCFNCGTDFKVQD